MSLSHNTKIVTDGLILCLDAANNKSYNFNENLFTYSQEFDNAFWSKSNSSITSNQTVAPDNTVTADLWTPSVTSDSRLTTQSVQANGTYALSFYVKSAGLTVLRTHILGRNPTDAPSEFIAEFNLSSQTSSIILGGGSGSANIVSVGNGWFRCVCIYTKSGSSTDLETRIGQYTTGNGTSSFYFWGAQLETSYTANIYTPTTTSTVIRSTTWTDVSGNGNNFSLNNMIYSSGQFVFNGTSSYATNTSRNWIPNYFTICVFAKDWTSGMLASSLRFVTTDHDGWRLETDAARTWHESYPENVNAWSFTPANWNMFSYSHSPTQTYSSINGQISNTTNSNSIWSAPFSRMDIGRYTLQNNFYLNGKVSLVLAYDRNLTSAELMQNLSAIRGRYGL